MSSRYKVLPLPFPFTQVETHWSNCVQEKHRIPLVFGRNGYYLDRWTGEVWLEINGCAWSYLTRGDFEFDLSVSLGNNALEDRIFNAAAVLLNTPLSSVALRKEYYSEKHRREMRRSYRNSMKFLLRFQRWVAEKEKLCQR